MRRGLLIWTLALLLVPALVSAQNFTVSVEAINTAITNVEQVELNLILTNNQNSEDTLRISIPDVLWNVQSDPLYYYFGGVDLAARETKSVRILMNPARSLPAGPYQIDYTVSSAKTGERKTGSLFVRVKSSEPLIRDYLAAVAKLVDIPAEVDPRDEFVITATLENSNPKRIEELRIVLSSNLINEERTISLGPLERVALEIPVTLDPRTPPQEDVLKTTLIADGKTLTPELRERFTVAAYADITASEPQARSSFLKKTTTITYVNDGNVDAGKVVEIPVNLFSRFFTRADSDVKPYAVTRDGQKYLAWELTLSPQEQTTITIAQNYRPLFYIIIIAALAAALYYFFRSSIVVRKDAAVLSFNEGGISEVKVLVHIHNRSSKQFENITVTDTLPYITDIEKDIDVGTLKPTKVSHSGNTTTITWDIDQLEPSEERILSYRMRSKLSILGGFILPPAHVHFYDQTGNKFAAKSRKRQVKA